MPSGGEAAKSLIASWLSSDVIACSELSELLLAFTPGIKPAKIVHNTSTLANFGSVFKVDLLLLWAKQWIYPLFRCPVGNKEPKHLNNTPSDSDGLIKASYSDVSIF